MMTARTAKYNDKKKLKKYIINGAGSHPNEAACREFYMPVVTAVMKSFD